MSKRRSDEALATLGQARTEGPLGRRRLVRTVCGRPKATSSAESASRRRRRGRYDPLVGVVVRLTFHRWLPPPLSRLVLLDEVVSAAGPGALLLAARSI